ncbi:MAG: glycosyltransferase family 2 protein [bacterium]|nr:glycosyltransferase family 2 protein [bacterium]
MYTEDDSLTYPQLLVVILNYNTTSSTLATVESVLRQDYRPLQIVVVDNGSSSDQYEALCRNGGSFHIVRSEENLGYSGGNNLGAKLSILPRPEYVLVLNSDVILPQPSTFRALVDALEEDSARVACSPLVNTLPSNTPVERQIQVRRIPGFSTLLVAHSWWLRRLPFLRRLADRSVYADLAPLEASRVLVCETINGCCFLIRRDFLEGIGFFDSGTFLYSEELILGMQIAQRGKATCLVTSAVVDHLQGTSTGHNQRRFRLRMGLEQVRSEVYFCRKYLLVSDVHLVLLLAVRTLDLGTKAVYQLLLRLRRDSV